MKKITLLISILALSIAFVSAQTETKKCDRMGPKAGSACCKTAMNTNDNAPTANAAGTESEKAMCPHMASGEKCANPENCPYNHDAPCDNPEKCDRSQKKSWYKFWGSDEKKDCCKKS